MSKEYKWRALFDGDRWFIDEGNPDSTQADDPWLMDVVKVDGVYWLCQFDVGSSDNFRHSVDQSTHLLGPYLTLDEAKTVAEMFYETLVVKT
jgi:hypothetical protein